jgi:GntR family transcriptional repressor for pyruvate dehydrogenase complex
MRQLRPVSRATLCEQVALQLADMIAEERWKAGEKLPSEAELCRALNIGRSTLREALTSLAFVGMVAIRRGDGTYVADKSHLFLERILARGILKTEKDLADVWEARMVLETELAALAALRLTDDDLEALSSLLERMESAKGSDDPSTYSALDLEFHLAIATASKNRMLHQLLTPIRGILQEWMGKSQELPGLRENAQVQHHKIFEALKQRSPERARKAMEAHLQTFQRAFTLLGSIDHSRSKVTA